MTAPTQTHQRRQTAADGGGTARAHAGQPNRRFTDVDIDEANSQLERAFALLGLIADGHLQCPACGANKRGKVIYRAQKGYWKCHPCGAPFRDESSKASRAVGLLMEFGGYSFVDAVNALLGRPSRGKPVQVVPTVIVERANEFQAVVDCDVYDAVVAAGSLEAAQRYYGRWHISAAAVAEVGCTVVADPAAMLATLTARFGRDRLISAGLVKPGEDGKPDYAMCNRDYPVVEPHRRPDGRVVGMQFRPSLRQEAKIVAHKEYSKARDAAKAAGVELNGPKVSYVPKFLSLRGGIPGQHIVGGGVQRVAALPPGREVLVVEGLKDLMAARTMGSEAYAIPGVGVMPPEKVCRILARHVAVICMDGDDGGEIGAASLDAWFTAHDVTFRHKAMPPGKDVTDVLVERYAARGCDCKACASMHTE